MTKDQTDGAQAAQTEETLAGGALQFADGTAATEHLPMPPEVIDPPANQGGDTVAGGGDAQAVQGITADHQHPSLSKMRAAIAMVENMNNSFGRDDLVKEIAQSGGVVGHNITDEGAQGYKVTYLGITATNPTSLAAALTVWCSRARRAVLSGIYTDDAQTPAAAE